MCWELAFFLRVLQPHFLGLEMLIFCDLTCCFVWHKAVRGLCLIKLLSEYTLIVYWLHFGENLLSSFIYSAVFIDPEKTFLPCSDVKRSNLVCTLPLTYSHWGLNCQVEVFIFSATGQSFSSCQGKFGLAVNVGVWDSLGLKYLVWKG